MARPKGSKNKPKGTGVIAVSEKRPRGRPRKNAVTARVLPNTELEGDGSSANLKAGDLPEVDDDYPITTIDSFGGGRRWTSDDWGGGSGFDRFSIGIDSMY